LEKIKFTKRALEALKPPTQGRISVGDTETPHLILTVTAGGAKSFYRYGRANGKPTRMMLGRFPEMTVSQARDRVAEINGSLAKGENPHAALRGGATVSDLWEAYFNEHATLRKKESSRKHDLWQWEKIIAPRWKHRKAAQITRPEVERLLADVARKRGKVTANRLLALVRKMFSHAVTGAVVKANPCSGIQKFPERSRDRYLQPAELPPLFVALDQHPNQTFADFIRLCLFVGARRSNLQAMRWEEIDWQRAEWRIPDTKGNDSHTVPLCAAAVEILDRRKKLSGGSPWVFPSHSKTGHLISPLKTWNRMLKEAGIEGLTIHDLRRSLGSWQAATGASELVIGKTLGHKPGSKATSIYARLNLDPVRASVDAATAAMVAAAEAKSTAKD
jgi:integrase